MWPSISLSIRWVVLFCFVFASTCHRTNIHDNDLRTLGWPRGAQRRIHNLVQTIYPCSEGIGIVTSLELGGTSLGKLSSRILVCLLSSCAQLSCVDTNMYIWMAFWHQAFLRGIWTNFPVKCWTIAFKWIKYIYLKGTNMYRVLL